MTDKENALRIIKFDGPERVATGMPCRTMCYHGSNHQGYGDPADMPDGHDRPVGSVWRDVWDVGWRKELPYAMGNPVIPPLDKPEKLEGYAWPDPGDPRIYGPIDEMAAKFRSEARAGGGAGGGTGDGSGAGDGSGGGAGNCAGDGDGIRAGGFFLAGSHRDTLWEKSYMLVGMENIMAYFYEEPGYAREILRRIMDFQMGIAERYIKHGVELAFLGDDLGTQASLLLSPHIIEEFLMPEYSRLCALYKSRGVLLSFHSCGHIGPTVRYFLELGIDVLNPVQASANDLGKIYSATEGKMALSGAIPTALLADGTPEDVSRAVRDTIRLLGKSGGYFCHPDQGMPFKPENEAALNEAIIKYGRYPIT